MRKRTKTTLITLAVLLVVGAGTAVLAETLPQLSVVMPKLAKDHTFPRAATSPGKVTFSHESHVDVKNADCTRCHPRHFRILEPGRTADGAPLRHEAMAAKRQCGVCHDGKAAFGLKDCDTCHSGK